MKEYLSRKGVPYIDKDVSSDYPAQRELVVDLGSRSTPTVVIGGDVLIGFEPGAIDAALAKIGL